MKDYDAGEIFWSEAKQTFICRVKKPNGDVKELSSKDKKKLRKKVNEYLQDHDDGMTFAQAVDAWEKVMSDKVEYKTYESYKPHVRRARDYFGTKLLKDITPYEVQGYIDNIASQDKAKDTVRKALTVVNKTFKWAIAQPNSAVMINPCTVVEIPKGLKKTRREPPTAEQLKKITPEGFGLFAWFMMYSGLRNGELLALRWEDIDRENKVIHVNKATHYIGSNPNITKKTKTEAGHRDVPLLDVLDSVLPDNGSGYVFGGEKPLGKEQFYREWTKWCASIGLAEKIEEKHRSDNGHEYIRTTWRPLVTPYQFRHEYASLLEEAGVSEFQAMKAMGHSSIKVTKDIYTHIRDKKRENDLAVKMNSLMSKQQVE